MDLTLLNIVNFMSLSLYRDHWQCPGDHGGGNQPEDVQHNERADPELGLGRPLLHHVLRALP